VPDGTARLWDVAAARPKGPPLKHDGPVDAVAFRPDGRTALTGSRDKTARLWDVQTQNPRGITLDHVGGVKHAAFSPDGSLLMTASSDDTARLWFADTQRPIGAPYLPGGSVDAIAFSPPDGRWITTGGSNGTVQPWRTPAPVEGSLDRLVLWVRVVTSKDLNKLGTIRALDLDAWQRDRQALDRLGGPPDRPGASGIADRPAR
jgi:WD40 repeat protein